MDNFEYLHSLSYKRKRDVKSSRLNIIGDYSSLKMNSLIKYESTLEMDFIHILEFDSNISKYFEQPLRIHYEENGKSKYYIPDFLVEKSDETVEVIEVKYLSDLRDNFSTYSKKFEAADNFCNMNGFVFRVLSEDFIRGAIGWNSKFLNYYRCSKFKVNFDGVVLITSKLKEIKTSTPKQLIDSLTNDCDKKIELLYYLWTAIANYHIDFDIKEKLSMNSRIWC